MFFFVCFFLWMEKALPCTPAAPGSVAPAGAHGARCAGDHHELTWRRRKRRVIICFPGDGRAESEWAQGGCTTLCQLPEEGRKVSLLLNHFHLCVFSPSISSPPAEGPCPPWRMLCKLIHFIPCAYAEASPLLCLWFALYSDCVSVQQLNANTAVKWIIHSSRESIFIAAAAPYEAPGPSSTCH